MRLHCMWCSKSVSTEVPEETIVRASLECPECIEKRREPRPEMFANVPAAEARRAALDTFSVWLIKRHGLLIDEELLAALEVKP